MLNNEAAFNRHRYISLELTYKQNSMEYLLTLVALSLLTPCNSQQMRFGANYTPSIGSVIADFAGNTSFMFTCDQFNRDSESNIVQITTFWTLENFENLDLVSVNKIDHPEFFISGTERNGSLPFPTFRNELTMVELTQRLHNVRLYCGHSLDTTDGYWDLRVYSGPSLRSINVTAVEDEAVSVDLSQGQNPAFPFPGQFEWRRNGLVVTNSSTAGFGYPQLNISAVSREDRGVYTLSATNSRLDDSLSVVGMASASVHLKVYFGPEVEDARLGYIGAEGANVSLICGLNLVGNPRASVQWLDREGRSLDPANSSFVFSNGPDVVDLTIVGAGLNDSGNWTCTITNPRTGVFVKKILALSVVAQPPQPVNVTVESVGTTWIFVSWFSSFDLTTNFTVTATPRSAKVPSTVTVGRELRANLTGLTPGETYSISVVAVNSLEGVMANSISSALVAATNTSVPEVVCLNAASFDGAITVSWRYSHTGGLNLTDLTVEYVTPELAHSLAVINLSNTSQTSLEVEGLAAGVLYTFRITAGNELGSAASSCPTVWHSTGIPLQPHILGAVPSSPLEIVLTTNTLASGTQPPDTSFRFLVRVRDIHSTLLLQTDIPLPDYQDGAEAELRINTGRVDGELSFEVVAQNQYGSSSPSAEVQVVVTAAEQIPVPALAGGVAGGALLLILLLLAVIVALCIGKSRNRESLARKIESSNSLEMVANNNYGKFTTSAVDGPEESPKYEAIPVNLSRRASQKSVGNDQLLEPGPTEKTSDNPLYSSTGELRKSAVFNAYDTLPPAARSRVCSPGLISRRQSIDVTTQLHHSQFLSPTPCASMAQYHLPNRRKSETILSSNTEWCDLPSRECTPTYSIPAVTAQASLSPTNGHYRNKDHLYACPTGGKNTAIPEEVYSEI